MIYKILAAILFTCGLGLGADEPPQQPKDFYVKMAALNLFTYKTASQPSHGKMIRLAGG